MENIAIKNTRKRLVIEDVCMDGSTFNNVCAKALVWDDVNLTGTKIKNANLSDIEIKGAQLGGAFFKHIGLGNEHQHPLAKQRPLRFENCDLNNSIIKDCDLTGVEIYECSIEGKKINGIEVTDLLKVFEKFSK